MSYILVCVCVCVRTTRAHNTSNTDNTDKVTVTNHQYARRSRRDALYTPSSLVLRELLTMRTYPQYANTRDTLGTTHNTAIRTHITNYTHQE